MFPNCPCLLREPHAYPWHDAGWRPPAFRELIIYQLHVGVFWGANLQAPRYGKFLDVIARIPYLRDLGVNAIQLLPIQEYDGSFGLGYAGLDYFSPEMVYQVEDQAELAVHLDVINALLAERGQPPLAPGDLATGPNQLKCLIDLVPPERPRGDLRSRLQPRRRRFRRAKPVVLRPAPWGDDNRSLYFTEAGWAGGKVFAYWQAPVRQYLIDNALFWLGEYRVDGIRYDEVTVMHHHGGDRFCRDLTSTLRYAKPHAIQIAEYWDWDRASAVTRPPDGLGFDAALGDRLRDAIRGVLGRGFARCRRLRPPRSVARRALPAARFPSRLDGGSVSGEPRCGPLGLRAEPRPRAPRAGAGGPVKPALLVRSQPQSGRDHAVADRSRHSHAVHGAGDSGGQAVA